MDEIEIPYTKKCFGWWCDCHLLPKENQCPDKRACYNSWLKSGGRMARPEEHEEKREKFLAYCKEKQQETVGD